MESNINIIIAVIWLRSIELSNKQQYRRESMSFLPQYNVHFKIGREVDYFMKDLERVFNGRI